ncbi:MAG: hypothetical protein QXX57_00325 [Nitrososphaerota archaeon]
MSFFKLQTREGSDDSYSTSFPNIGIAFPMIHGWSPGAASEVAQLIHVPKACPSVVVKVPLKASAIVQIPDFSMSFQYRIAYNTNPPDMQPNYREVVDVYNYKSSVNVELSYVDIPAFLKLYSTSANTSYGLKSSIAYRTNLRLFSSAEPLDSSSNLKYSIFEFKTTGIAPGWYWFIITTSPLVTEEVVPIAVIKNIAETIKTRIWWNASNYIQQLRQSGVPIYNWQLQFYHTDDSINYVDSQIRSYIVSEARLGKVEPSFYDGFAPYGLGPATFTLGGIPRYFVRRVDIGTFTGFVPYVSAIKSGNDWQMLQNDRYMITKVEKGAEIDDDFDVKIRFSLKGDLADASCWTEWEKFTYETGWQAKGLKQLLLTNQSIGGNSLPGTKTVYVNLMRRVLTTTQPTSQYALGTATVYFTGEAPIITSVRVSYLLNI